MREWTVRLAVVTVRDGQPGLVTTKANKPASLDRLDRLNGAVGPDDLVGPVCIVDVHIPAPHSRSNMTAPRVSCRGNEALGALEILGHTDIDERGVIRSAKKSAISRDMRDRCLVRSTQGRSARSAR